MLFVLLRDNLIWSQFEDIQGVLTSSSSTWCMAYINTARRKWLHIYIYIEIDRDILFQYILFHFFRILPDSNRACGVFSVKFLNSFFPHHWWILTIATIFLKDNTLLSCHSQAQNYFQLVCCWAVIPSLHLGYVTLQKKKPKTSSYLPSLLLTIHHSELELFFSK